MGAVLSPKFGATVDSYCDVMWQALGQPRLSFPRYTLICLSRGTPAKPSPLLVLQAENKGVNSGADPASHPTLHPAQPATHLPSHPAEPSTLG